MASTTPSVLKGLITNSGLGHCIRAADMGGWAIYPTGFGISDQLGVIEVTRSIADIKPTWYNAPISGRIVKSTNTIEFLCTIPPGVSANVMGIKEIYVFAETNAGEDFLLAICGIEGEVSYDPAGSTKLRILITIQNLDLMDLYVFKYTQAMEIEDHNNDPNAHPDLISAVINITNPVIINNNYAADAGDTIFADSTLGPIVIQLVEDDIRLGTRVTVVDVGWAVEEAGHEIRVQSSKAIDNQKRPFIFDLEGGYVDFVYYPALSSWLVNVGGRFYKRSDTELRLTEYLDYTWFNSGGSSDVIDSTSTAGDGPGGQDGYPAKPGNIIFVNTTKGKVTIWLPTDADPGDHIQVIDTMNYFNVINAIAKGQGKKVAGSTADYVMNVKGGVYNFYWDPSGPEWRVIINASSAGGGTGGGGSTAGVDDIFWAKSANVANALTTYGSYTAIVPKTDNTESIGTTGRRYQNGFFHNLTVTNVISGTSYRSLLGDLAEYYDAGYRFKSMIPGTVVAISREDDCEICEANPGNDSVIGVVSTSPGLILAAPEVLKESQILVGIKGKVPVRVIGRVTKGNRLSISSMPGVAMVSNADNAFAYALESSEDEEEKLVKAFIR
jgi:hypothetical protein